MATDYEIANSIAVEQKALGRYAKVSRSRDCIVFWFALDQEIFGLALGESQEHPGHIREVRVDHSGLVEDTYLIKAEDFWLDWSIRDFIDAVEYEARRAEYA